MQCIWFPVSGNFSCGMSAAQQSHHMCPSVKVSSRANHVQSHVNMTHHHLLPYIPAAYCPTDIRQSTTDHLLYYSLGYSYSTSWIWKEYPLVTQSAHNLLPNISGFIQTDSSRLLKPSYLTINHLVQQYNASKFLNCWKVACITHT
jgi:hypothetical protein